MNKFKVGDRVRRLYRSYPPLVVGGLYTVEGVSDAGNLTIDGKYNYVASNFELVEPTYPNPPHKHHDVIIAWAKGAEIEVKERHSFSTRSWLKSTKPSWFDELDYRIKPVDTRKDKLNAKLEELQAAVDSVKKEIGEL